MRPTLDNSEQHTFPQEALSPSFSLFSAIGQLPRQYFTVIAQPSVRTLRKEAAWSRWDIVTIQFLILIVVTTALNWLGHRIPSAALHSVTAWQITVWKFGPARPFTLLPAPYNGIVFILATFLIGLGTAYPFSKLSKGQGKFVEHTFILLLITIPLVTISGALLLIPAKGLLAIALVFLVSTLFIYRMVLHVFTIMAVHHLDGGKATLIVLIIPMLIAFIALMIFLIFGLDGVDFDIPDFGGGSAKKKVKTPNSPPLA